MTRQQISTMATYITQYNQRAFTGCIVSKVFAPHLDDKTLDWDEEIKSYREYTRRINAIENESLRERLTSVLNAIKNIEKAIK